jgi:hypothetical protein
LRRLEGGLEVAMGVGVGVGVPMDGFERVVMGDDADASTGVIGGEGPIIERCREPV